MQHWWLVAIDRAFGVLLGCALGMMITFIFHQIEKWWEKKYPSTEINEQKDER